MRAAEKNLIEAHPALDFIHFQGVGVPYRPRRTDFPQHQPTLPAQPQSQHRTTPEKPAELDPFVACLLESAGVSPDAYLAFPLHRRLPALLRMLRVSSPLAAHALLQTRPDLMPATLNTLFIGVTSFFRDAAVFDFLRTSVLPALLQRSRGVKVFCAGVSNGCELYSIAILLAEAGALKASSLFGIDCRPGAIERAREGHFSNDEMATVGNALRERYFRAEGATWRVDAALRANIRWRCTDLLTYQPDTCDLILFRNVAIYLERHSSSRVWEMLNTSLAPGGFLVTGRAERPSPGLPLRCVSKSVYQKHEAAS